MKITICQPFIFSNPQDYFDYGTEIVQTKNPDEVVNSDAIISKAIKIDKELIDRSPNLKIIANHGVGLDNIDLEYAREKGIKVFNTPYSVTEPTANLTISLILSVTRFLFKAQIYTICGLWEKENDPDRLMGVDLSKKVLGIIGMGRIGRAVAKRAHSFDMNIVYYSRTRLTPDEERMLGAQYIPYDDLLEISDVISIHLPLTEETEGLINEKSFKHMKDGVFIINTSRGKIIKEQALIDAIKSNKVQGAGLDVFENEPVVSKELLGMKNVIITPHIGSATKEARRDTENDCLRNIEIEILKCKNNNDQ